VRKALSNPQYIEQGPPAGGVDFEGRTMAHPACGRVEQSARGHGNPHVLPRLCIATQRTLQKAMGEIMSGVTHGFFWFRFGKYGV
jgi:hypothetical protein